MLLDFTHVPNIFIVCGKTDLRKGIDGLAAFVTETYQLDFFAKNGLTSNEKHVFYFGKIEKHLIPTP